MRGYIRAKYNAAVHLAAYMVNPVAAYLADPLAELSALRMGLVACPDQIDESRHREIVQRITGAYFRAKEVQPGVSLPYQPGGEWDQDIKTRRDEYIQALGTKSLPRVGELCRNFFRNSGVAGIWVFAYYQDLARPNVVGKMRFINYLLHDYALWQDLVECPDLDELAAPMVGNPWGYVIDGRLVMPVSFRHHYWARHTCNLLSDADEPIVAEIGGGYGGFGYYLLSTGKGLRYLNFDLPEVLLISSYYLLCAFPEKRFLLFGEHETTDLNEEAISSYDVILAPNFQLPTLPTQFVDMFFNTNSLSEMDYDTVTEYTNQISRVCKRYFFHVNSGQAVPKKYGHVEVPSSRFPISSAAFKRVYKTFSLWEGGSARYREHLYERVGPRT